MARHDCQRLYGELTTNRFSFIQRGEHHLDGFYSAVKRRYPSLCDDSFLCADNCSKGHEQPEWQHVVRKALQALKSAAGPVCKGERHAYWQFQ